MNVTALPVYVWKVSSDELYYLKRRLSSRERWKMIFERYYYYASVEEHQRKNIPWKVWLFKSPVHILNMTSNSLKMMPIFMTHVCVVLYTIHLSVYKCTVLVTLPSFWWLQNLAVHTNTYMLHDQLFRIDSTPFLYTMQSHDQNSTLSLSANVISIGSSSCSSFLFPLYHSSCCFLCGFGIPVTAPTCWASQKREEWERKQSAFLTF